MQLLRCTACGAIAKGFCPLTSTPAELLLLPPLYVMLTALALALLCAAPRPPGLWPFSYDACDENALVAPGNWTDHKGQRINRCNSTIGGCRDPPHAASLFGWVASAPAALHAVLLAWVKPTLLCCR